MYWRCWKIIKCRHKRMVDKEEWLTIAQAAQRLGLAERQARRYAQHLPDSCRTVDRTPAGRGRTLVNLAALSETTAQARAGKATPDTSRTDAGHAPDTAETYPVPLALAMTAQRDALERVISEQAARISDLQAALDHERDNSKRISEALAREQTLRLLTAPEPAQAAPEAAPESQPPTPAPPDSTAPGPEAAPSAAQRPFWLFWKRS
jgi:hypothetical protein